MKENKLPEIEIISKYLAGEATPEEALSLHESLNDLRNKDEYNRIIRLWKRLHADTAEQTPSTEEEWSKLDNKIRHSEKFKIRKVIFNRFAVAASISGFIFILAYTWFTNNKKAEVAKNNERPNIFKTAISKVTADTLPDGSIITMNKNSSIEYASAFNDDKREIALIGESFFNVVPDKTKPFTIVDNELKIEVVGTSFNVRNVTTNNSIEVQVQSGIVKMLTAQKEITVIKGQTGIYYKADGELHLKDTLDVNSMSYATKTFSFINLSLVDACSYLEKAFYVTINIDSAKFSDCRLSAEFNNKPLEYILSVICATLNCSYNKRGVNISITGQGCK